MGLTLRVLLTHIRSRYPFPRPAMNAPISTQVLTCSPETISFTESSTHPQVSSQESREALKTAVHELITLQVPVVCPTETVYGLAASALSPSAVAQIFSIKGRPPDNPLIVHISSYSMLWSILPPSFTMPPSYEALTRAFWPGPLTLLFPASTKIPKIVTASRSTVAIRMPSHPVARGLIALAGMPLAAPSANISGKPSPTKAEHVLRDLSGRVGVILDGGSCNVGIESTVVDGLGSDGVLRVLRPGGVTVEDIQRVVMHNVKQGHDAPQVLVHRKDYEDVAIERAPTTPGMKYQHYSPSMPVILLMTSAAPDGISPSTFPDILSTLLSSYTTGSHVNLGLLAPSDSPLTLLPNHTLQCAKFNIDWHVFPLGTIADPSLTAKRLFDGLLTLESKRVDLIFVEGIAEVREGLAVMNRIQKAAGDVRWVNVDWVEPAVSSNSSASQNK